MTHLLAALLGATLACAAVVLMRRRRRPPSSGRRIAFPFLGRSLSEPALASALRLARAESATLVPIALAVVPRRLPLASALPRQSGPALDLLEVIEQRAAREGVPVDGRIERGRTSRHALTEALGHEPFARVVIAAETRSGEGFTPADVAWALEHITAEIVVLRAVRPS